METYVDHVKDQIDKRFGKEYNLTVCPEQVQVTEGYLIEHTDQYDNQ